MKRFLLRQHPRSDLTTDEVENLIFLLGKERGCCLRRNRFIGDVQRYAQKNRESELAITFHKAQNVVSDLKKKYQKPLYRFLEAAQIPATRVTILTIGTHLGIELGKFAWRTLAPAIVSFALYKIQQNYL